MVATFSWKSEGPAICTPFSAMVAEEIRFLPLASPFTMCRLKGEMIQDGAVNVVVYSLGFPIVLVYVCGPKTGVFAVTCALARGTNIIRQRKLTARISNWLPRLAAGVGHAEGVLIMLLWGFCLAVSMPSRSLPD